MTDGNSTDQDEREKRKKTRFLNILVSKQKKTKQNETRKTEHEEMIGFGNYRMVSLQQHDLRMDCYHVDFRDRKEKNSIS